MGFKEWLLKEIGTSTACVAGFSRIAIPMQRRIWPTWGEKKRKIKKQPQVEENST